MAVSFGGLSAWAWAEIAMNKPSMNAKADFISVLLGILKGEKEERD